MTRTRTQAPRSPLLKATQALPLGLLLHLGAAILAPFVDPLEWRWPYFVQFAIYVAGIPLVTLGYGAGIALLLRDPRWQILLKPLAPVGQMSLTNYLLQSVICTTLFYSYGLGLFGKVGPLLGLGPTIAIFAGQVVLSGWWLRRFRFGPVEWLWRRLTYGRTLAMRAE